MCRNDILLIDMRKEGRACRMETRMEGFEEDRGVGLGEEG